MKTMKNKGFTLAELLIVMAVIVVLAAIAIPTFAKQLETARESSDVENIRAAASEAFSEAYTAYVTDDQVQAGYVYYSTIYRVKFNQHEANFQYMTPVIEIGTSNDPQHNPNTTTTASDPDAVSGAVEIRKTPAGLLPTGTTGSTSPLPGDAYLQFQFTVSPKGYFYLTDILGWASTTAPAATVAPKAYGGPTSGTGAASAASGFASLKPDPAATGGSTGGTTP